MLIRFSQPTPHELVEKVLRLWNMSAAKILELGFKFLKENSELERESLKTSLPLRNSPNF